MFRYLILCHAQLALLLDAFKNFLYSWLYYSQRGQVFNMDLGQ